MDRSTSSFTSCIETWYNLVASFRTVLDNLCRSEHACSTCVCDRVGVGLRNNRHSLQIGSKYSQLGIP